MQCLLQAYTDVCVGIGPNNEQNINGIMERSRFHLTGCCRARKQCSSGLLEQFRSRRPAHLLCVAVRVSQGAVCVSSWAMLYANGGSCRFIQEIGGYLNGSAWTEYFSFPDSDPHAGVACSVSLLESVLRIFTIPTWYLSRKCTRPSQARNICDVFSFEVVAV